MRVECSANIPEENKRNSLCTCVKIIGGIPEVKGDIVIAKYEGDVDVAMKYIDLFERCKDYDIKTTFSERR